MVFESIVIDVLNRFLGDYVVNLDSSQLTIGIWGGKKDLILNLCLFVFQSELDVPFKVKAGHIAKLQLKIPWNNLYNQPVDAILDGVYLLVVPSASITYDAEKERRQLHELKQRELKRIEEAKQKVADKGKPKEEKQDTFVEKLVTQVIKNLQVQITNIHIRYEDNITNENCPLSFGVFKPCTLMIHFHFCLIRLDSLCAYWNVNTVMYSKHNSKEALKYMKDGVATGDFVPENYQFIFRPISARAKLEMNPRGDIDFTSPKTNLEVKLQDIAMELKRPQYVSIMELLGSVDMMSRNLPYRKYKPNVPCHNNAGKWWKYAINGILEEDVKPVFESWSWKHIQKHRQKINRYKGCYKTKITTMKPDDDLVQEIDELEEDLDLFNITLARQQAEMEAMKAGFKIYRPGVAVEDEKGGGWFDWMWNWGGAKDEKLQETKTGISELMTPEEKSKLYAAIGYSEAAVDPTVPKRYEALKIYVSLQSMSFSIKEEKLAPTIMKIVVMDLSTVLTQRPGAQAIKLEAQINTFEVTGLLQNSYTPCLLSSRNVAAESEGPLLKIMFETNPLDENADQRLRVGSQPLEIVYDARSVNSLVGFFQTPRNVELEQLTSATLMKLEEFRDRTATGLMYIIETQKVIDFKINLMSSYVIVPQNGLFDNSSSLLILDLGHLKMMSRSRTNLPQLTIGESALEDIMARAYDTFDMQLSSIQLLYAKPHENWKEARKTKRSSLHILEPMDLKLEFSRAMVISDARMPKFKLYGGFSLLSFCISDEKFTAVLSLIDTSIESEEEFFDAPSSPTEDSPFFLARNESFKRVNTMQQKQLKKQESMKNMTEFQMEFEITKVSVGICRHMHDGENPVLLLEITGLGTELKIRTYDMTAVIFLKEVCLTCPEHIDTENKPIYIITTLDNFEDDLLSIEYTKADRNGPEFKTTYRNTEQLIKINFSSLDAHLHTEALLSSINFLNSLVPSSKIKAGLEEPVRTIEESKKEDTLPNGEVASLSKPAKFEDVINLHVFAELACLRIFIQNKMRIISEISIEGLDAEVIQKKKVTEVVAILKNIVAVDSDERALYRKAVSITGKEVFNFKMISHVDATQGATYTDMNAVDSYIKLTVGCIQVIFVKKFISSVLDFINIFQAGKEAVTEATVHAAEKAASGVKDLAERSTRMSLDVHIKAPVVVIPQSPVSKNVVVADFGLITVQNSFSIVELKSVMSVPPVVDTMKVKLSELKLYRTVFHNKAFRSEVHMLQPVNLIVIIKRNLAATWYHEMPDIEITGILKPMSLVLSQEDLIIVLKTLNENLSDDSIEPGTAQLEKVDRPFVTIQNITLSFSGRTVVTAAVVETQKPLKIKTQLKLDFQLDELSLVLDSQYPNKQLCKRSEQHQIAQFKLHTVSASVKMISDGSMNAVVKLSNCMLDDKRHAIQKAKSRMLEMKMRPEKQIMLELKYKQGREGTFMETIVDDVYLCASMEFLLTVTDFFLKANEQKSTEQKTKTPVAPATSKFELTIYVRNPEIVFVADLTREDAPALVMTAQCEVTINSDPDGQQMTATVRDLKVLACPFIKKRKSQTVLQPCDLFFQSNQYGTGEKNMELAIKLLMLKVSPVIINTVLTITSALSRAPESPHEKNSQNPSDLWDEKNVKDLKFWFLQDDKANKSENTLTSQLVPTSENLNVVIEFICVTLEAGVGHRTIPMLLAKSAFKGTLKNWSTFINLQCNLTSEVHYYNEVLAVWEPLLEPLEVENSECFRPWELWIKIKKKVVKQQANTENEKELFNVPEYKTVINISSKDQLNITLSKCGLNMLNNLGMAFAEAASQTAEVFQKDQAPFAVKNSLGLPVTISPHDLLVFINQDFGHEPYELTIGENLSMDYQPTTSEKDQLLNLTCAEANKLFYISLSKIVILGHSTAEQIPLTKLGRRMYNITYNESTVQRCIICQIDADQGSKIITIRSPLQVKNHFTVPFNVFENTKSNLNLLGTVQPKQEFNLPLPSYRSDLCFQLITKSEEVYDPCEMITFDHIKRNTNAMFSRECQLSGSSEQLSLIINLVAMRDQLTSDFSDAISDEECDAYVLHLWPPAILQTFFGQQLLTLEEGHSAQLHNAELDKSKLELHILNYFEHSWEGEYYIKSNQKDIEFVKFTAVIDNDRFDMDIAIHLTYNVGHVMLALYSPYWMLNKTGRMLQYKADDIHHKHPLDYNKPLLFSFRPKNFFHKNKVQLRITDSNLSDEFSLDTVASYGCVKCKGMKKEYQVGVKIDTTSFNLTRIATFTPFYLLINHTKYRIEVTEETEENWFWIDSNQCVPFWPDKDCKRFLVRVEGCSASPKKVYFNKQENYALLRLDNKFGGIIVDVHLAEHSTVITFSDYHEGAATFLIINHTSTETIEYHQSCSTEKATELPPGKAMYYTWEDLTGCRTLICKFGNSTEQLSAVEDKFSVFDSSNGNIYLTSIFEGTQRVVVFTKDEKIFKVTKENEKAELAAQEINLSLQNLGLSLVNNSIRQEVVYIGITSSDIVWETKIKAKSRWKPTSIKQTRELEKVFKDYKDSGPQNNQIVESCHDFQALLTPTGLEMRLLKPYEAALRRSYLPAIKVEYAVSAHQKSLRFQIYRIQIQNQLGGAIFPFPFCPIIPPKSINMDSDFLIIYTYHRYFMVLIQEMDLKVDLGFLFALMELINQPTDDISGEQKVELFQKDLECIQMELMDDSFTDTSPVSLYEYFHISPIKLHLSFSLSAGGEDPSKEQGKSEVMPLQSVNLLLKSIGATLTDAQDLVFRLACFELNNQFYTAQELQQEVVRHYSKQAIKQLYVLFLGLDVLGNPYGLIRDLSEGVTAFFYEPYQGAIQGPEEFVEGMALGVKALVGGAVGGFAGAASRITGAMAKGVAAITMDEEYQQRRREAMNKQPSGFTEGITRGGRGLVSGFVSGITGIVTKPIEGAQREGAVGFFKGMGKGLVGAIARPTGGIIDMANSTFQGIKRATETSEDAQSLRPPRFIHEDGVIRPYRLREGVGSQMLQKIENGRFAKYKYFAHKKVNDSDLFMITKSGVFFVTKGTFGQLTCEWQYSFEEFTKKPFIVLERRLRIEAKVIDKDKAVISNRMSFQ
uniref:Vacuolar protein sorting 13 homolog A n=1 Tax=Callorhinchus milii TaxID=7868 RepID=A0A4W3I3M5_CALMI